jgi:hypothetical protein
MPNRSGIAGNSAMPGLIAAFRRIGAAAVVERDRRMRRRRGFARQSRLKAGRASATRVRCGSAAASMPAGKGFDQSGRPP